MTDPSSRTECCSTSSNNLLPPFACGIFFLNDTATTEIYTLSLHDALPILGLQAAYANLHTDQERDYFMQRYHDVITFLRSEERFSRNAETDLVCRLLLEKKKGS